MPKGAKFSRRIGAWFYDLFILMAIEMLAVGLVVAIIAIAIKIGFSIDGYIDAGDYLTRNPVISPLFTMYVFSVAASFYGYFWTRYGQTVGMKTWNLKVVNESGGNITFTQALIRMATSCLGLGNLLALYDKNNRALQDHFSNSQVIKVE